MIGQYTLNYLLNKPGRIISSARDLTRGKIIILLSRTVNYYKKEADGSWTNYDCKTIDMYI